jgi:hypothetical protein
MLVLREVARKKNHVAQPVLDLRKYAFGQHGGFGGGFGCDNDGNATSSFVN